MKKLYLIVFILGFLGFFQHLFHTQNANLTRVGEWGAGSYIDISIKGNYAFCVDFYHGLEVIDISNRSQPVKVENYNISGYSHAVDVSGNYAYLANGGLVIVDVSDPSLPVQVGHYHCDTVYDVKVKNNFAYLAGYSNGLQIIDVSSPSSPILVGQWSDSDHYFELFIKGNEAYMLEDFGGVIINITDPSTPILVGAFGFQGYPSDVYVSGNYA